MAAHTLLAKAGSAVATGLVGAAAYDLTKKVVARVPFREGAVVATAWGLRGTRKAEEVAENVRLSSADIVAEAKERIGEEATPPGTGDAHDHEH
ncbi:DUF1490 family protein [Gordonia aichiensis]|uniref:DUF1490 family protein n=1 Tax=Gordonia aichiensis NBRC 108223 TaxID=1220583 RepID=L7KNY7_9ACTN|nr:DUF1490 family protein [Gordonia aichiensis]GAC50560.1 hypothetical protein GOACH_26_00270 [Gordonia aichiensis NBRC 108223]